MAKRQKEQDDSVGNTDEMVNVDYEERELEVPLTAEEKIVLGDEISQAQAELEENQSNKKAFGRTFDGKIEKAKAEVSTKSKILRVGVTTKPVQVQVIKNYREHYVKETRMDTNEVLVHRVMTSRELQAIDPTS